MGRRPIFALVTLERALHLRNTTLAVVTGLGMACASKRDTPQPPSDEVVCTRDAKVCPDGSTVGRRGPDCSFDPCPGSDA